MEFAEITRPLRRAEQADEVSCLSACVAMALQRGWDADPGAAQHQLRANLRPWLSGGSSMTAANVALANLYGIPSEVLVGWSLGDLSDLVFDGDVILGVDPSMFYTVGPNASHAILLATGHRALLPSGVPREFFPDFVPPVLVIDPHPHAPATSGWTAELLDWAFDARGRQALWVPTRDYLRRAC